MTMCHVNRVAYSDKQSVLASFSSFSFVYGHPLFWLSALISLFLKQQLLCCEFSRHYPYPYSAAMQALQLHYGQPQQQAQSEIAAILTCVSANDSQFFKPCGTTEIPVGRLPNLTRTTLLYLIQSFTLNALCSVSFT